MKNLLLATLIAITSVSSTSVKAQQQSSAQFNGTTPVSLTYLGSGIKKDNGCLGMVGTTGTIASIFIIAGGPGVWVGLGAYAFLTAACTDRAMVKQKSINMKLSAAISSTSSDRVTVLLKSKASKKCAGFSMNLLGETDGFGNYELYANKEAYLANTSLGTMTKLGDKLALNIEEPMTIITKGKKGFDCRWDLTNGLNAELK